MPEPREDRDLRQRDLVPPEQLARCSATVVGVGAIGRQVALQLAALGLPRLQLIDPQLVESVNLAAQGYREDDLGQPKAEATAALCRELHSEILVAPLTCRFRRSLELGNVVFCCVDSIATRRMIWAAVKEHVQLFVDGRMSGEAIRVLAANDGPTRRHYPRTLFPAAEAHAGSCTSRSTIYAANVAAGLMVTQFTRQLRQMTVDADVQLNLLSMELAVTPPAA